MADIHIDDFFADAATALVHLYAVFPRPIALFAEDISGPDEPDEYGVHSQRYKACFAALVWLGDEGFLRYDGTIRQDAIDQAVLSGRCFTALQAPHPDAVPAPDVPPSVAVRQQSIIYRLQQAVKGKASLEIAAAFTPLLARMTER